MRKKKKELTVFSLSALDLFCSAMGVFMILCFIVFPYYMKDDPLPTPTLEPIPVETPPPPPPPVRIRVEEPRVKKVPAVSIAMHWEMELRGPNGETYWSTLTCNDVDMVIDAPGPNGRRLLYNYKQRQHEGSPARYQVDARQGGGELWVHPAIIPGRYEAGFNIFSKDSLNRMLINYKRGGSGWCDVLAHRVCFTVLSPQKKKQIYSKTFTDSEFKKSPKIFKVVEVV